MKKDTILSIPNDPYIPLHPLVAAQQPLLGSFIRSCRTVIDRLLAIFEHQLGLTSGTLSEKHRLMVPSGDHVRFNRSAVQPYNPDRARAGEHTDFGSLTLLFNWLGGLQIRLPPGIEGESPLPGSEPRIDADAGGEGEWVWVPPRPGCCVVNLGDALVILTAGLLRSNIHRVVPPPSAQAHLTRLSLVYFCRPEDDVRLKRLKGGLIDQQPKQGNEEDEGITAREWVFRRSGRDLKGVFTHAGGLERRSIPWAEQAKAA